MSRRIVVLLSASLALFLLSATCSHGQRLPEDEAQRTKDQMSRRIIVLLSASLALFLLSATCSHGQRLPEDEVQALEAIAEQLGKTNWNTSVNPCTGQYPWAVDEDNNVTCACSLSSTTCHVVSISLKSQSLRGTLPPDFVRLPYLVSLDLTRNYLSGSIPREWGSMANIQYISLLGNNLIGRIPEEIGNISTLRSLFLESNELEGQLPPQLGNLPRIERMLLSSNRFSGELPPSFANLKTLIDVRLSDNTFTGKIPDFIGNWTNLTKLTIHGSGLQGPIPSSIGVLKNLTDLRITDLDGIESPFPNLSSTAMKTIILRNCNLVGELPSYLAGWSYLNMLDVSFNKLIGKIPSNFATLGLEYLYLTGNQLTGSVPNWTTTGMWDLSYNNFTGSFDCQVKNVNLFTTSSVDNNLGIASCMKISHCPQRQNNLYINCGGKELTFESSAYMEDMDPGAPARFYTKNGSNWAYSSTGNFMDDDYSADSYIIRNTSAFPLDDLYLTARVSPISLTYYGYCLVNGNYTVHLHFAEIAFTRGKNYTSLGRRIFDIYIQGKRVLDNFDIVEAAGGIGVPNKQTFSAAVTSGTLEIHLYWAGKGTVAIPSRGVYGPLISAIAAVHDFVPQKESRMSPSAVAGIVISVAFVTFLVLGIVWWKGCLGHSKTIKQDLQGIDFQAWSFTFRQIKDATGNFHANNKIGEGGFGVVYKGTLSDGTVIAVKQLSARSKQGTREFLNEVGMLSALQHPHLVKLYGCCTQESQMLLVYEYVENNSLARALFGPVEFRLKLDWRARRAICLGIAKGLAYLHEEARFKIVHRDIKATNVLLDGNLSPKISDFGLAKLCEEDNTHISTRIAGTFGYMAPEYALRGYLTDKADVYSFGIVLLETVSGQSNSVHQPGEECLYILEWAHLLEQGGNLIHLVDWRLGSEFDEDEAMVVIRVALLCTNASPSVRPPMSSVVRMLEGKLTVPASIPNNPAKDSVKLKAMRKHFMGIREDDETKGLTQTEGTTSQGGNFTYFSAPLEDHSMMIDDSGYFQKRGLTN